MNSLAPKHKLLALAATLGVLTTGTVAASGSWTTGARVLLGGLALAGLGIWFVAQRGVLSLPRRFAQTPRLQVVQATRLSPRTGVALIEVDGRSFLIVHGEGAPRIRRVPSRASVLAQGLKEGSS